MHYTTVSPGDYAEFEGLADWQRRGRFLHATFRAPSYAAAADLACTAMDLRAAP